ncbi:prepilin-type N-terminal cleavage/methylation domain-containing protein [Opitutaceae bacterium TAV1]|nr:prepilin-type N-terminal cleavage/methylation domain-containing protein [Opitutaceae bacterium TAV1]
MKPAAPASFLRRSPSSPPPRISAFTLIELLTVIAIIGILAAILIPTVSKVRKSARLGKATSNIRQLQVGNILLATENRGQYVAPMLANGTWWYQQTSYNRCLNFQGAKDDAARLNPVYRSTVADPPAGWPDFGYNRTGLSEAELATGYNQSRILNPSRRIAFMDALFTLIRIEDKDLYAGVEKRKNGLSFEPAYRHDGKALVAFWDAHVRLVPRAEAIATENADMWYPSR